LQPDRTLRWEGCCNIRDLGGLPLEGGGETRFGVVVRADDLSLLSEQGWKAASDYGVVRIVDLRHEDPPYDSPIELVRQPLLDASSTLEVDDLPADVDDPVTCRRRNYLFLLDRFRANFASAVGHAEVEREHGSARGYLLAGGAAQEDLDRLNARLRG
jgi:hypothetical protein